MCRRFLDCFVSTLNDIHDNWRPKWRRMNTFSYCVIGKRRRGEKAPSLIGAFVPAMRHSHGLLLPLHPDVQPEPQANWSKQARNAKHIWDHLQGVQIKIANA